jgi:beta-apo-4'-carotenal oxygenase
MTSGGATLNDSFFHGSIPSVPFGGVGTSGVGACRGRASFDTFTHRRTVAETPAWMEPLMRVRYMPYNRRLIRIMGKLNGQGKPNFDRNGQVVHGLGYWTAVVLGLGTSKFKGALLRWLVVLTGVYIARAKL